MAVTQFPAASNAPRTHLSSLLHQLTAQLTTLLRQELRLARTELHQSTIRWVSATSTLVAGYAILYAGLLLLLVAAVAGLCILLPLWLAALSIGLLTCLCGWLLLGRGRRSLRNVQLAPSHLPDSLRRDKDVLLRRTHP